MIDIDLPPLPQHAVDLVAEAVPVRREGEPDTPPDTAAARILLGGPLAVPVTADYVAGDAQLRTFVEGEAAHAVFHLVHAAVTFESTPADPPLESAVVGLRLSVVAGAIGGPDPVAWSMAPLRTTHPVQQSTTWRLGPKLTVLEVEASLGEIERTTSHRMDEVFIEAGRLLRSDPEWRFRRTSTSALDGAHRLVMVVRGARDAGVRAEVSVQATVRRRGLLGYRSKAIPPYVLAESKLVPPP